MTAAKKTAKTAAKTVKATAEKTAPAAKKSADVLRKPQVRILKALAKSGKPLARKAIAEKAGVDEAGCVEWLGSPDATKRKANDAKHFPSLVSRGLVRFGEPAEGGAATYEITAAGREAAKKAE